MSPTAIVPEALNIIAIAAATDLENLAKNHQRESPESFQKSAAAIAFRAIKDCLQISQQMAVGIALKFHDPYSMASIIAGDLPGLAASSQILSRAIAIGEKSWSSSPDRRAAMAAGNEDLKLQRAAIDRAISLWAAHHRAKKQIGEAFSAALNQYLKGA